MKIENVYSSLQKRDKSRSIIIGISILLYFLPVVILSTYTMELMPLQSSWNIFNIGLVIGSLGAIFLVLFLRIWENLIYKHFESNNIHLKKDPQVEEKVHIFPNMSTENSDPKREDLVIGSAEAEEKRSAQALEELQEKYDQLAVINTEKCSENEKLHSFVNELEHNLHELKNEYDIFKELNLNKQHEKEDLIREYQEKTLEQNLIIEKKQQRILHLENKERDLNYEIKTLLQLAESDNQEREKNSSEMQLKETKYSYQILDESLEALLEDTKQDAVIQLRHCLSMASKITSASPLVSSHSRMRELPVDHNALDLRRLFDILRLENDNIVFFYSQKENRILFVNNEVKDLLGWTPEKFIQSFSEIVIDGLNSFQNNIINLQLTHEAQNSLVLKTKDGEAHTFQCNLGIIPSGVFKQQIIGVLSVA